MCTYVVSMMIAYQFKLEQPKSREEQDAVTIKDIAFYWIYITFFEFRSRYIISAIFVIEIDLNVLKFNNVLLW